MHKIVFPNYNYALKSFCITVKQINPKWQNKIDLIVLKFKINCIFTFKIKFLTKTLTID